MFTTEITECTEKKKLGAEGASLPSVFSVCSVVYQLKGIHVVYER